jgi:hypothetical protein
LQSKKNDILELRSTLTLKKPDAICTQLRIL